VRKGKWRKKILGGVQNSGATAFAHDLWESKRVRRRKDWKGAEEKGLRMEEGPTTSLLIGKSSCGDTMEEVVKKYDCLRFTSEVKVKGRGCK